MLISTLIKFLVSYQRNK